MIAKLFLLPMVVALTSCMPRTPELQSTDIEPAPSEENVFQNRVGYGRYFGRSRLSGVNSREHYVLQGRMEDQGGLTLHSHFNGFLHLDGMRVGFKRLNRSLKVEMSSPDYSAREFVLENFFYSQDGDFRLRIEVHDGIAPGARVLVWNDRESFQGETVSQKPILSATTANLDTAALKVWFFTHGRGSRWGLELENCFLVEAHREAPYVP